MKNCFVYSAPHNEVGYAAYYSGNQLDLHFEISIYALDKILIHTETSEKAYLENA